MITPGRVGALLLAIALVWTGYHRVLPVQDAVSTSFSGYWVAARAVVEGVPVIDLYDDGVLAGRMRAEGFPFGEKLIGPPSLVLTLWPFGRLDYVDARRIWLWLVCLPSLGVSLLYLQRYAGPVRGGLLALLVCASPTVEKGFAVGQVYMVFLLLHCLVLEAGRRRSGALLAFGTAPMLVSRGWYGLLMVAAWVRGRAIKGALTAAGASVALFLATLPIVGVAAWRYFFGPHLAEMADNPWAGTAAYQTIRSLVLHATTANPAWGPDPPIPLPGLASWLYLAIALGLVAVFGWLAGRAETRPGGSDHALLIGAITTLQVLLSPLAEDYHYVLLTLPAAILLGRARGVGLALTLAALPLLFADLWDWEVPELTGGWRSLAAYPRVWGGLLLLAASAWTLRARR